MRVGLRPIDLERHSVELLPLYSDPVAMKFIGGQTMEDAGAVRLFLERRLKRCGAPPLGFWAVEERGTKAVIGTALLDHPPISSTQADPVRMSSDVQIGLALRQDRWRFGYGRELGLALLDYAVHTCRLNTLIALAEPEHRVSVHLMETLGFTFDGETHDYYGGIAMYRYSLVLPRDEAAVLGDDRGVGSKIFVGE